MTVRSHDTSAASAARYFEAKRWADARRAKGEPPTIEVYPARRCGDYDE